MGCGNSKGQVASGAITLKGQAIPKPEIACNSQKDQTSQANNANAESPSKVMEVKTCVKDIEGLTQQADMTILEFSKLSMTDLVSNGMFLINAVIGLIKANLAQNQLMKAVLRRMQSLEPTFQELQTQNNKYTKELIVTLVHIVNRIKTFCEKYMATDKCLWDQFKDAITAKSHLAELANLNDLLTKAQNDLQLPMQVETQKKIDKMFDYLKEINEKSSEVFGKNQNNNNILPMAQRCLTNEEAFVFWFGILLCFLI